VCELLIARPQVRILPGALGRIYGRQNPSYRSLQPLWQSLVDAGKAPSIPSSG
jgi:hypothetical protein